MLPPTSFQQSIQPRLSQAKQKRRKRRVIACLAALSLLFMAAGFWGLLRGRGIAVTVTNLGTRTLHRCYLANDAPLRHGFLGDIPPGGTASARVRPGSKGGLMVCYSAENGGVKSLFANSYWGLSPRGSFSVTVQDNKIVNSQYAAKPSSDIEYVFDDFMSQMRFYE